jgi:repressor LexA
MTDTRPPLTQAQAAVRDLIRGHVAARGYAPTIREIGAAFGFRSTNGVVGHLNALERKGYLRRDPGRAGGIRLIGEPPADGDGLRAAARDLVARCRELDVCLRDPEAAGVDGETTRSVWRQAIDALARLLPPE